MKLKEINLKEAEKYLFDKDFEKLKTKKELVFLSSKKNKFEDDDLIKLEISFRRCRRLGAFRG